MEVVKAALETLPGLVGDLAFQSLVGEALARFERLIDWSEANNPGLDVFSLSERIELLRGNLEGRVSDQRLSKEKQTAWVDRGK